MMTTSFQATMQLLIMIMGNYSLLNSTVTNGSTCTDNKKRIKCFISLTTSNKLKSLKVAKQMNDEIFVHGEGCL